MKLQKKKKKKNVYLKIKRNNNYILISSHFLLHTREGGHWGCYRILSPFFKGPQGFWSQSQFLYGQKAGYTLDESPAHRREIITYCETKI